jgi:DNA-binding NarL/FixJ family response regulator
VELWLGRAARFLGLLDDAISDLSDADRICRQSGAAGFRVEAAYELAAAVAARAGPGDVDRARELLDWASTQASALGVVTYGAKADALRRELMPATEPLTRREREIAALVAEGLSNRQIADRLFVSERTAQNHVQHILTKLGLPNRGQVALWYERSMYAKKMST